MNAFTLTGEFLLKGERETLGSIDKIDKKASGLGGAFTKAGKIAAIGIAAIGTAAIAVGSILFKVGEQFDNAFDTIRIGTGKTGEVLEGLQNDFREVAANVPASFEAIGQTIADLNTRLDLTGKPLQNMTTQMLNLARIAGEDVNTLIPATTRVFGDWSIATDKQSETLDYLFKISQNTGIGVTTLSEKVVQFGAPLRQMGFDFETSAAMIGKWEKEGVNAELVLGSMRIALGKFATEGVTDTNAALIELIDRIKNAGSTGEGTALAMEYFGSRAGPDMAAAIREGRFDLEELIATLKESKETINDVAIETMDFGEQWQLTKNNIMLAIEPISGKVFSMVGDLVKSLSGSLIPQLVKVAEAFTPLFNKILEFIPVIADRLIPIFTEIAEAVIPVLNDILGVLIDEILPPLLDLFSMLASTVLPPLMELFGELVSRIMPPLMEIFKVIVERILPPFLDLFTVIVEKVLPPFMDLFLRLVDTILPPLVEFFAMLVETIMPPFIEILELIMEILEPFIDLFAELLEAILPPLMEMFTLLAETILPPLLDVLKLIIEYAVKPLLDLFGKLIEWALPYIIKAIEYLAQVVIPAVIGIFTNWQEKVQIVKDFFIAFAEKFMEIWNGIKEYFIGIWNSIEEKFNLFKENFLKVWEAIKEGIKVPINAIIRFINRLIEGVEGMVNAVVKGLNRIQIKMPDWLGGKTFGFNLKEVSFKNIPELARGGIITSPGFALVGEAGPELLRLPQGASVEPLQTDRYIEKEFTLHNIINLDGKVAYENWNKYNLRELARRV